MLAKLGWKAGEGLGKSGTGATTPVPMIGNVSRGGIGSLGAACVVEGAADIVDAQRHLKRVDEGKVAIREITMKRFLEAESAAASTQMSSGNDEASMASSELNPVPKPKFSMALKKRKM
jgi:hypothetical protein